MSHCDSSPLVDSFAGRWNCSAEVRAVVFFDCSSGTLISAKQHRCNPKFWKEIPLKSYEDFENLFSEKTFKKDRRAFKVKIGSRIISMEDNTLEDGSKLDENFGKTLIYPTCAYLSCALLSSDEIITIASVMSSLNELCEYLNIEGGLRGMNTHDFELKILPVCKDVSVGLICKSGFRNFESVLKSINKLYAETNSRDQTNDERFDFELEKILSKA